MKKIILALGFGLFLMAFSMHLKTSVDSPLGLVTEASTVSATGHSHWRWCYCTDYWFYSDDCKLSGDSGVQCKQVDLHDDIYTCRDKDSEC